MDTKQKQDLMNTIHAKYGRRLMPNGSAELLDTIRNLSDEELEYAVRFEKFILTERANYPSDVLLLLLQEQMNRYQKRSTLSEKVKKALKNLKQKLRNNGDSKE